MSVSLKDICTFQSGGTPARGNAEFFKGTIPWITTTALNGGVIGKEAAADWITQQAISESAAKIVPAYSIFVGTRVGVGKVAMNSVDMSTSQDIISLLGIDESKWSKAFICKFLQSKSGHLNSQSRGATIKGIKIEALADLDLPEITIEQQQRISCVIDIVKLIIASNQQQLQKLDELIKARFVEMFGDPIANPKGWRKVSLSELAEIKIGPFGSLLHKEDYCEGGHALVNPSHIINGRIAVDDRLTVDEQKYADLTAYHLKIGDVVMGRRGEMGRCAVVETAGLLCGTGSLLIRAKSNTRADYIQKIISFPSFKMTIEDMAVGQTMSNLNVPIVASFQIIKPPIAVQDEFAVFVAQVDKSKFCSERGSQVLQNAVKCMWNVYMGGRVYDKL